MENPIDATVVPIPLNPPSVEIDIFPPALSALKETEWIISVIMASAEAVSVGLPPLIVTMGVSR